MIYLVFALIVAAALLYLIFSDSRAIKQGYAPVNKEADRLRERLESIKLSLRDVEYEKTVGKLDEANFSRLQNELLTEWDSIESKIATLAKEQPEPAKPAAKFCSQCGTAIVAAAKFCHACGAKLAVWLMAIAAFFTLQVSDLSAMDIRATVQNGTEGRVETRPMSVQLLKLEQGMQPVTAKTSVGGKVEFLNLPEMKQGPYMVQTIYKGVTYSRVIPPNMPSPAEVNLEIFDSTASTAKVRVRTLVEMRRTAKDTLSAVMILFFVNSDNRAFTGGPEGLEFILPDKAEVEQASISVGSGTSNIQWLKLTPKPGAKKGHYSVGQNVKPGDRILQVMFRLPYDEKGTAVKFQSLYPHQEDPQDRGFQIIAEPDNIELRQSNKLLQRMRDSRLDHGLFSFAVKETAIELTVSGGDVMEVKKSEEAEAELEVKSPLALWQKLLFPLVAVAVFGAGAWYRSRKD